MLTWAIFASFLGCCVLVSWQVEAGEVMGNDRLNMTARAAGFAMAYDETVGRPSVKSTQVAARAWATSDAVQSVMRGLEHLKAVKPVSSVSGWSFWKTA